MKSRTTCAYNIGRKCAKNFMSEETYSVLHHSIIFSMVYTVTINSIGHILIYLYVEISSQFYKCILLYSYVPSTYLRKKIKIISKRTSYSVVFLIIRFVVRKLHLFCFDCYDMKIWKAISKSRSWIIVHSSSYPPILYILYCRNEMNLCNYR